MSLQNTHSNIKNKYGSEKHQFTFEVEIYTNFNLTSILLKCHMDFFTNAYLYLCIQI